MWVLKYVIWWERYFLLYGRRNERPVLSTIISLLLSLLLSVLPSHIMLICCRAKVSWLLKARNIAWKNIILTDGQRSSLYSIVSVPVFTGSNKWLNRLTPWSRVPLKLIIPHIVKKNRHFVESWLSYTPSPCFMPICFKPFCCNALCQFTLHCNLCFFIFGLTPFGWLCSSMLTPLFLMGI